MYIKLRGALQLHKSDLINVDKGKDLSDYILITKETIQTNQGQRTCGPLPDIYKPTLSLSENCDPL